MTHCRSRSNAKYGRELLLVLAIAATGLMGCSRQSASLQAQQVSSATQLASIPMSDDPPAALINIGESARLLFDAAYASDWSVAAERVQSLNESASELPMQLPKPDLVAQLQSRLKFVRENVSGHQRVQTMDDANAITRLVDELSTEFHNQVPFEALMLGFYGRQLELGLASQQPSLLTRSAADLESTWKRIEPAIERRGHADDAKRFSDIVVQLVGARRPADFVSPARAELSEADRIEKLFQKPT